MWGFLIMYMENTKFKIGDKVRVFSLDRVLQLEKEDSILNMGHIGDEGTVMQYSLDYDDRVLIKVNTKNAYKTYWHPLDDLELVSTRNKSLLLY